MDNQVVWNKVLDYIKSRVHETEFSTWFKNTKIIDSENSTFKIGVPYKCWIDIFKQKYEPLLHEAFLYACNTKVELKFVESDELARSKRGVQKIRRMEPHEPQVLESKYTFENFVVGKSNELAAAASKAVAQQPGSVFNPLFIYGGVGLGKTHLLQAIGNYIKNNSRLNVLYISSNRLHNDWIQSIQENKQAQFIQKLRRKDVLLIDDVQELQGKDSFQDLVFHTFNELYSSGKQIVLTSDRPPNEIPRLSFRLLTRFQEGLICDIKPPSFEMRKAILLKKAQQFKISLPDEIIEYIARRITNNVRALEGALIKIYAVMVFAKKSPTLEEIKEFLKDLILDESKPSFEKVLAEVSNTYHIPISAIRGKRRTKDIAFARQVVIFIAREFCEMQFKDIGSFLGGRDHSTIIHDYKKMRELYKIDKSVRSDIDYILSKLGIKK